MKLKKIASVALAGVMAVSVLAGCGADNGANSGNTNTEPTTSTAIVDVINNAQGASNLVKIDFTDNAAMTKALKTAAEKYGYGATDTNLTTAITNATGLKLNSADKWKTTGGGKYVETLKIGSKTIGLFLNNEVIRATDYHGVGGAAGDEADKTYSLYSVVKYDGSTYLTEEAVMNAFAKDMNTFIATLAVSSDDNANATGDVANDGVLNANVKGTNNTYYAYTYDASASMVSIAQPDGTTDYFVAFVVNQHIADKEL